MLTICRTRGIDGPPELLAPIRRAELNDYEPAGDEFGDEPPLTCEVWPGGGLAVRATLPAAWVDGGDDGRLIEVGFPVASLDPLSTGRYMARVRLVDGGQEIARFVLAVLPAAGSAEPRPAYHVYEDLLREQPAVERYADDANDQTGFAATSADARDWIDARILAAARQRGSPRGADAYAAALAAERLRLDTPDGRRIVRAGVYRTLSTLMRRSEFMTVNSDDLAVLRGDYAAMAEAELDGAVVEFSGDDAPPPLTVGGRLTVGRVTR